jgi:hypothetical protein
MYGGLYDAIDKFRRSGRFSRVVEEGFKVDKAQHEIEKLGKARIEERRGKEIQGEWERQRVGEAARAHYTRARGEELELEGESNSYSDNGAIDSPRACLCESSQSSQLRLSQSSQHHWIHSMTLCTGITNETCV